MSSSSCKRDIEQNNIWFPKKGKIFELRKTKGKLEDKIFELQNKISKTELELHCTELKIDIETSKITQAQLKKIKDR